MFWIEVPPSVIIPELRVRWAICMISIATDSVPLEMRTPSYGGIHTSVFGKLAKGATTAYVPSDPSIALPMIITALSQTAAKFMKGRKRPSFSFAGKDLGVEVP